MKRLILCVPLLVGCQGMMAAPGPEPGTIAVANEAGQTAVIPDSLSGVTAEGVGGLVSVATGSTGLGLLATGLASYIFGRHRKKRQMLAAGAPSRPETV